MFTMNSSTIEMPYAYPDRHIATDAGAQIVGLSYTLWEMGIPMGSNPVINGDSPTVANLGRFQIVLATNIDDLQKLTYVYPRATS